jgi:hypothetical protein
MGIFRDCVPCRQEGEAMVAALRPIGIEVRVEEFDNPFEAAGQGERIDLLDGGTSIEVADPASFLGSEFLHDIPGSWLPPSVRADVERLSKLTGVERRREANALADRLATVDVPVGAVGYGVSGAFLAPELGCRVFPPFGYGVDLAGLCLQK